MAHVVIVTPVYKHSRLVADPIRSVLSQSFHGRITHLLIADGCPFHDTHYTLKDFANSHPSRIHYLRKENGGLSSARNYGIDFALASYHDLDAIYFLDADNCLAPYTIHRFYKALKSLGDSKVWVYPDIDMIGIPWNSHYGGPYSPYVHARINMSEAGSMISTDLARSGLRFDESFRNGWEDWEFWLSCNKAGASAVNLRASGFKYRKRPESMVAVSDREPEVLFHQIHEKHPRIKQPRHLLELESQSNPRYAIITQSTDVLLCTDPRSSARISLDSLVRMFYTALPPTYATYFPGFIVVANSVLLDVLEKAHLLNYLFFELEAGLDDNPLSFHDVYASNLSSLSINRAPNTTVDQFLGRIYMMRSVLMSEIMRDTSLEWVSSHLTVCASASSRSIVLPTSCISVGQYNNSCDSSSLTLEVVKRFYSSSYRFSFISSMQSSQVPVDGLAYLRFNSYLVSRDKLGCFPVSNIAPSKSKIDIGFAVPLISFGGVEKVLLKTAAELNKEGISCHLFVSGTRGAQCSIHMHAELESTFETLNFLSDDGFEIGSRIESPSFYYGTSVPDWASRSTGAKKAIGMLCCMNIVINYHVSDFSGIMGRLRSLGVKTACSLHVIDQTALGLGVGNVYNSLAFEHAYDFFLPCSASLASYLASLGIPADKIIPVINFSSIDTSQVLHTAQEISQVRAEYHLSRGPLRLLYLGRLDYQKGLSLLVKSLAGLPQSLVSNISLKIVGGSVLCPGGDYNPLRDLERAGFAVESMPPIYDQNAISRLLSQADFLLLPSRYEGLPLVLIEAMQHGVIPVATNVGAVSDLVKSGFNGFAFETSEYPCQLLDLLGSCLTNRDYLMRLSVNASDTVNRSSWAHSVKLLVDKIKSFSVPT